MTQEIRVYRRFYVATSDVYTAIDPFSLSANVYNTTQGNSLVQSAVTIVNTTTGEYYADLDRNLYNSDDIYEINWIVNYTNEAPTKNLYTKFKFPMGNVIGRDIQIEIIGERPMEYKLIHNHTN